MKIRYWMAVAVAAAASLSSLPAHATCDECCHETMKLLGWSADGASILVRQAWEDSSELWVVLTHGVSGASHIVHDGVDQCATKSSERDPPLTSTAPFLARTPAWSSAFWGAFLVRLGGPHPFDLAQRGGFDGETCATWELVQRATGRVLGVWPRDCSARATVVDGFIHPTVKTAVVALHWEATRLTSYETFEDVPLP
jgi:hypothetical protein